mmetsp:Transcript_81465/g.252869  ORF Transcript_81465/g.252869 Transcript_81465/m.252869 type:complete len:644 (+) Transcript_81465:28-1959(+)
MPRRRACPNRQRQIAAGVPAGQPWEDDAPNIFSEVVPVHVKPSGRDEFTAALTVRLKPDNPTHPRSLLLELTDEADLLFYHSLVLGEGDFHTLKAEQRLLVDFQSFPAQLAELLRRCMEASNGAVAAGSGLGATSGTTVTPESFSSNAAMALRMIACLECGATADSMLSIVESNQFRELTHLALRLRQGTDEAVKQHLAGKLRACRAERAELADSFRNSEEALERARRQADELGARAHVVAEERQHLEHSLEAKHQRELAELRQEHAQILADLQRRMAEERTTAEAELRASLDEALGRALRAERSGGELERQREALATSGKSCQERLGSAEAQLTEARQEVLMLREQVKQLELLKFQHEREIGELKVQLSSMKDQLTLKEQLVTNQMSQLEQSGAQRKSLEDMLASVRQQAHSLEEKFALSAQEIAKGNQIIQNLHTNTKQAKAKLRLKSSALVQQEKAVLELEKAEEMSKHVLEEKDNDLSRAKEREERLQREIEELKKKLAEAHEVLKSDQDVIEYLNRQLTERDLKVIPAAPVRAEGQLEPRPSALADLLRRAESVGRVLHGDMDLRGVPATGAAASTPASVLGAIGHSTSYGITGASTSASAAAAVAGATSLASLHGPVAYRRPDAPVQRLTQELLAAR